LPEPSLELRKLLRCDLRRLRQKTRLLQLQAAWRIDAPGLQQIICVGEPDLTPLMADEIKMVFDPFQRPDQPWALNIWADTRVQIGRDCGSVEKSLYAHIWLLAGLSVVVALPRAV
jgi:hypothetical protein